VNARIPIDELATAMLSAQDHARAREQVSIDHPSITVADGYAIQRSLRALRVARGERVVGRKAGVTSRAKMRQVGIDVPSFGFLTHAMACPEGAPLRRDAFVHPRVEAEIAIVTSRPLRGRGASIEELALAIDFVVPAIEVIDSRFRDFKFDLPSVIADNGSAARYVTGGYARELDAIDLRTVGVVVRKNGEVQATAAGAAVLDHPLNALALLLEHLDAADEQLPAGSLVLTGGITEAIPVERGDSVVAHFQHMGSVTVRFE
jgi:2-oxo-3-hexenedioate decarboxylase